MNTISNNFNPLTNNIDYLRERTKEYLSNRKPKNTKRCYKNDFELFTRWCEDQELSFMPSLPETVCLYMAYLASTGLKSSTISRRLAAIKFAHNLNGYTCLESDLIKGTLEGIKRTQGSSVDKKTAARIWHIKTILGLIGNDPKGVRDKALIALTLACAFRGSEPLSLNIEDIEKTPEGFIVYLRRSKVDQQGKGRPKALINGRYIKCADLLQEWLDLLKEKGIEKGALFRRIIKGGQIKEDALSYRAYYNLFKEYVKEAGFDQDAFGTHSMRRGFVTEAFEHEATIENTRFVTDHKKIETLLDYKETVDIFKNYPGHLFL